MKYKNEFENHNKKDFIKILIREHEIKKESAERTWYKYRKLLQKPKELNKFLRKIKQQIKSNDIVNINIVHYKDYEKEEPNIFKMIMFKDMIRLLNPKRITRELLTKYHYNNLEINWLKDNGYNIHEDK
jgi:hypothetical protein